MSSKELKFTKRELDKIRPPRQPKGASGSVYDTYKDTEESGLQLIVTHTGSKAYYFRAKINGKSERVRLGNYEALSIEQARARAREKKALRDKGINPNHEKRKIRAEITLKDFFEQEYLEKYAKHHKKSWKQDQENFSRHLSALGNKKLSSITKETIEKLHTHITRNRGGYVANRVLALLSVMFAIAIERGWDGVNPAHGIRKNKEKARDRFIQGDEFARFFKAVMEEPKETARDYFLLSLFCGQRKSNMLAMRWDEIDFSNRTWRILNTKNGEPQTVGLTEPAMQILQKRKKQMVASKTTKSAWVFPSDSSESGHYEEPQKAWKRILQRAQIDDLRIHDIRRTMGSYMAMGGAGQYLIGKALGHKSSAATEIYARVAVDPVREAQEQAAKRMLELMAGNP